MAGLGASVEMKTNVNFEDKSTSKEFTSDAPCHRILDNGFAWEANCLEHGLIIHNVGYQSSWGDESQNLVGLVEPICRTCGKPSKTLLARNVMFRACDWEIKFKKLNSCDIITRRGTTPPSGYLTWSPDSGAGSLLLHEYKSFVVNKCVPHRPVSVGDEVFIQNEYIKNGNLRGKVVHDDKSSLPLKVTLDDGTYHGWYRTDQVVKVF